MRVAVEILRPRVGDTNADLFIVYRQQKNSHSEYSDVNKYCNSASAHVSKIRHFLHSHPWQKMFNKQRYFQISRGFVAVLIWKKKLEWRSYEWAPFVFFSYWSVAILLEFTVLIAVVVSSYKKYSSSMPFIKRTHFPVIRAIWFDSWTQCQMYK